jgi:CheY-like chemotaxis protein
MRRLEGLSILVIGDRLGFVESLAPPLRADGHVVGDVPDGALALAAARSTLPDVVVLDADVAGLDAPAVVEGIGGLSVARRPLFIALTGDPIGECPPTAVCSRVDLYLGKPADTFRLRNLLRRFQTVVKDFEGFDPMI